MKTRILLVAVTISMFAFVGCATNSGRYPASGGDHDQHGGGGGGRAEAPPMNRSQGGPRAQGVVMAPHPGPIQGPHIDPNHPIGGRENPPHQVLINNDPHRVVIDHRPPSVVSHDPHVRVMVRRNFRPIPEWNRYHPGFRDGYTNAWWGVWGINSWQTVGTVTCEATNEQTGELYPVTAERDGNGWDDPAIDDLLDQALADCSEEATVGADGINPCIAATPACSFESWDGVAYRTN